MTAWTDSQGGSKPATGRLFYLMGASGSGKDSLLRGCRERCASLPVSLMVAHRYITREPDGEGENHVSLSSAEFEQRVALGTFAMHWTANGHRYGVGLEIDHWLEAGGQVLVNGSRAYLEQARSRYGATLCPVLVRVDPERLRQRLVERGRESVAEIDARVQRARALAQQVAGETRVVDNNDSIDAAVADLLQLVQTASQPEVIL